MNYPVLKSVITFFSHIFHSVPRNAPSVPFAPRKLFLSARSEDVHCQEDIILHLSLAEVVFSLCIHGIVAENHCDGAGGWRGSVLSWHPLPNNWMAYQVTPRSLIALFRPWLAETPTVTAYSEKKGRERISKIALQLVCARASASTVKFKVEMRRRRFASPFFLTSRSDFYHIFQPLSAPSLTEPIDHASVYPLIQCYWVISGDGLSSRSSQTRHRFLITTNQKPDASVCFCTVSPRGSARRYITLGSPSVALP